LIVASTKMEPWIKYAVGAGGAVLGGIAGFFAGGVGAIPGALAGWTAGYGITAGVEDSLSIQEKAQMAEKQATDAANQDREEAALEQQSQAMGWNQAVKGAALAERQTDIQASQVSEQSRKAAIETFQAESSGQAALATSGVSGGTPYMALDQGIAESQRAAALWFANSKDQLAMTGGRTQMGLEGQGLQYRSSGLRQKSLLNQAGQYDFQALQYGEEGSDLNLAMNITGKTVSALVSAVDMYMTVGAVGKVIGTAGLDSAGNLDFGKLLEAGTNYKYAQFTGDTGPLLSMFSPASPGKGMAVSPGVSDFQFTSGYLPPASPSLPTVQLSSPLLSPELQPMGLGLDLPMPELKSFQNRPRVGANPGQSPLLSLVGAY
jgi:hypothetical protein